MEKIEPQVTPNDYAAHKENGAPLSRQVTVNLSNEQYERLFLAPGPPAKGDLAKRFGNPTLLGVLCFLIPFTSTMLSLCQLAGAEPPYTLVGFTGDYYMIGGIGMILAGLAEFILGNTFPMTVFIIYGTHWASLAYTQDPIHNTLSVFEKLGGASGAAYNSSQAFHNVTMCIVAVVFFVGTLRINVIFNILFIGLILFFAFVAAADFAVPSATTTAEVAHVLYLLKIAGSCGFVSMICGWYLAFLEVCQAVGIPNPMPVFDLSSKVFPQPDRVDKSA